MIASMRHEDIHKIIYFMKSANTYELAQIVEELRHIGVLVAYNPIVNETWHVDFVTIIDDAIHLILDPKELF